MKFSRILEEQVVRTPLMHMLSLIAIGMPDRGPVAPVMDEASSGVRVTYAPMRLSTASMRSVTDVSTSAAVTSPLSIRSRRSCMVKRNSSTAHIITHGQNRCQKGKRAKVA